MKILLESMALVGFQKKRDERRKQPQSDSPFLNLPSAPSAGYKNKASKQQYRRLGCRGPLPSALPGLGLGALRSGSGPLRPLRNLQLACEAAKSYIFLTTPQTFMCGTYKAVSIKKTGFRLDGAALSVVGAHPGSIRHADDEGT